MFPDSKYLGSYSYRHCTKVRAQLRRPSCCSGWVFANLSLRDELMIRNQFISGKYGDPPPALPSPPQPSYSPPPAAVKRQDGWQEILRCGIQSS